jgi:hypothetical protein
MHDIDVTVLLDRKDEAAAVRHLDRSGVFYGKFGHP